MSLKRDTLKQTKKTCKKSYIVLNYHIGGDCIGFIILRQLDAYHGIKQMNNYIFDFYHSRYR